MSISNKTKYALVFVIGLILTVASIAMFSSHNIDHRLPGVFEALGLYLMLLAIFRYARFGNGIETDERTRRVSAFACYYTFLLMLVAMGVLFEMDVLGYLDMTVNQVLTLLIILMCMPFLAFYFYFNHRGDV